VLVREEDEVQVKLKPESALNLKQTRINIAAVQRGSMAGNPCQSNDIREIV